MRTGLRVLGAVLVAASFAACDTGGDDVELYEGEEAATPSLETTQPPTDAPLITAEFTAAEGATEAANISGTVRVFPEGEALTGAAGPAETEAEDPNTPTTSPAATEGQGQGFRVEVTLAGITEGEHAWHIHEAACGQQGPVVVPFSAVPGEEGLTGELEADDTGRVEEEATVPSDRLTFDQLRTGTYSLRVHAQGGENHGPAVACADLSVEGTTTTM